MCIPQNDRCDGWSHPFSQTLHIGDLIIVQGIAAEDLNSNYPNSDVIVFHKPDNPDELVVHRIVTEEEKNGSIYFLTKGDGNGINKWPNKPSSAEYDPWQTDGVPGIREDLVVGKVVMRIPWLGHIVLFMRNSVGLPIIIALIIVIIIIEFVLPIFKGKKPAEQQTKVQQTRIY
jgi:signal peptidase I